jgi:protein-S-isoprenylcysteine O-methyltransferase Ste14
MGEISGTIHLHLTNSYDEMAMSSKEPTDLRKYRRQTERRLTIAVVVFLVLVGGGLIGLIYGPGAAFMGISCLLLGAGIIGLLFAILTLMERWAKSE